MPDDTTYTIAEVLAAQKALREAAGGEEEVFELADVIGMVSDEIDMIKEQGYTLDKIAALIQGAIGTPVTARDVEKYYVPADERDIWDEDENED